MLKQEVREFSLDAEIIKLRKILTLPITNIVFDDNYEYGKLHLDSDQNLTVIYAKIYINDTYIGEIPYSSTSFGPMYNTPDMDELDWNAVFKECGREVIDRIRIEQPKAVSAEIRKPYSLYVKDSEGQVINLAFYNYIENDWQVVLSGLDIVEVTKKVTITVEVPPLPVSNL